MSSSKSSTTASLPRTSALPAHRDLAPTFTGRWSGSAAMPRTASSAATSSVASRGNPSQTSSEGQRITDVSRGSSPAGSATQEGQSLYDAFPFHPQRWNRAFEKAAENRWDRAFEAAALAGGHRSRRNSLQASSGNSSSPSPGTLSRSASSGQLSVLNRRHGDADTRTQQFQPGHNTFTPQDLQQALPPQHGIPPLTPVTPLGQGNTVTADHLEHSLRTNPTFLQIRRLKRERDELYGVDALAKLNYAIEWWNMMPAICSDHGLTLISRVGHQELYLAREWLRIDPPGSPGPLSDHAYYWIINWMADYPANETAEFEQWKRPSYGPSMRNLNFAQVLHRIRDGCLLDYMGGNPPPSSIEHVNMLARLQISPADLGSLSSKPAPRPTLDDMRFTVLARCWCIARWTSMATGKRSGGQQRELYYMKPMGAWQARWLDFVQAHTTLNPGAIDKPSYNFDSENARNLGRGIVVIHNNPWELIVDFALGAKTPQEIQDESRRARTRL